MAHIDLLELPYFVGIGIEAVVSLIDAMAPCTFAPGATILAQAAPTVPPLYIVTRGRVGIVKHTDNGPEQPIAHLQAPTVLGEVELFGQMPAVATARAVTQVHAFALTQATFDALMAAGHPAVSRFVLNIAKVACHRLAKSNALLCTLMGDEDVAVTRAAQRVPKLEQNA